MKQTGIISALPTLIVAMVSLAATSPVAAQYDRDGRYVPAPMGVPADPNARVIPGYSGSPGGAIGTPTWPRDPDQRLSPMKPRAGADDRILTTRTVPLTVPKCRAGWSKRLGITRAEFEIRCAKIDREDD